MSEVLHRVLSDAQTDGRTIHGVVVPYGQVAVVNDGDGPYRESFAQGAFQRSLSERGDKVRLYTQHNRSRLPLGKATEWADTPEGLRGAFKVPDTTEGNDALTLVREGVVDSFSVGFRGITSEQREGVTVRTEAALHEVSLVADPAYTGARVAGIRSQDLEEWDEFSALEWVAGLTPATRAALAAVIASLDTQHGITPDDASQDDLHGNRSHSYAQAVLCLRKTLKEMS